LKAKPKALLSKKAATIHEHKIAPPSTKTAYANGGSPGLDSSKESINEADYGLISTSINLNLTKDASVSPFSKKDGVKMTEIEEEISVRVQKVHVHSVEDESRDIRLESKFGDKAQKKDDLFEEQTKTIL
jgi:hypothetical protein